METSTLLLVVLIVSLGTSRALEPISFTASAIGLASAVLSYLDKTPCRFYECCDRYSISTDAKNITALENVLKRSVYGQHLMHDIVIRALKGHLLTPDPAKALVLSFHGTPGSGKSYVSDFIAQSLFVKGMRSAFVRKFLAADFPDPSKQAVYQIKIADAVREVIKKCERALFIFEDVSKMPHGVLDGIVAFIDHHSELDGLDFRKSIFILLSNSGAAMINQKTLELWTEGKQREDIIKLKDFESAIRDGAFNEEGGLYQSATIRTNLIDHYIPFLPLEEKHVRLCIDDAFKRSGYSHTPASAVEKILEELTFMPPHIELYSTTGCKRVASKVSAYVYGERFTPWDR